MKIDLNLRISGDILRFALCEVWEQAVGILRKKKKKKTISMKKRSSTD